MTGLVIRGVALGCLSYLLVHLFAQTNLYATGAVVLGVLAIASVGMTRAATRLIQQAVVEARNLENASQLDSFATSLSGRAVELDYTDALLDIVPAALFVVDGDRVKFMNRSARALARKDVATLTDITTLGSAAARLAAMRPGAREMLNFADGSAAHASCALLTVPGTRGFRLLAVQRVAGDLDAVEAKAWGDMARVLAHEIMNSLTPIASLSESLERLLQDRKEDAEIVAALEVIKRRSYGLMNFVERYRVLSELPKPNVSTVDVTSFLEGIERLMSATLRERGIEYVSRIVPSDLVANLDRELLEQALINLLRNAAEAVDGMPSARIEIECDGSSTHIAFNVRDNGRGLPDEEPGKLLTPFFSTKPNGGGIGLSVARHVALAHGGQLNIRRRAGGGAEFSLVVPAE